MTCVVRRSAWLVAVYAVLAAAPVAMLLLPVTTAVLPLMWLAMTPVLAGLMILAFWVGLGNSRILARIASLFAGIAYLVLWPSVMIGFQIPGGWKLSMYIEGLLPYLEIGIVLSAMFAIT